MNAINLRICYQGADGNRTERFVSVATVANVEGRVAITGLCHLRHQLRTFYADRMSQIIDMETGEVAEDCERYIRDNALIWTGRLAASNPSRAALKDCRDDLIVLTFVAASDGEFHPDEMDCAVLHVMESCDCELDEQHVRTAIAEIQPTEEAFAAAVERIGKRSKSPRPLLRSLRRMVDADGEVKLAEMEAVAGVEAKLLAQAGAMA